MSKILILVEGQTEERFVKSLLYPALAASNIFAIPTIAATKRVKSGMDFKGGLVSYEKVRRDLIRLLNDSSAEAVTTMFDYYALPRDFPGRTSPQGKDCYEMVESVEKGFREDVDNPRFIPYLQLHEFEALLFSSPSEIAGRFEEAGTHKNKRLTERLKNIRDQFKTPEEINDNKPTHPSRRLQQLIPSYRKAFYGTLIASGIGLETIRSACPHFNSWLHTLENLA